MVHDRITENSRELLLQIKEMAEKMGYEVLHGIVDCLWVIGEPISVSKEAGEEELSMMTKIVDKMTKDPEPQCTMTATRKD